jgi:amino acid adenylation domain-containing protein
MSNKRRASPSPAMTYCILTQTVLQGAAAVRSARKSRPVDQGDAPVHPLEPLSATALETSIVERFDAVARYFPDRIAIRDGTETLTYRELAAQADRISNVIGATIAGTGPIAILLSNEARYPAAILGVLAAGRACVALDAGHPIERNSRIAAHAGVEAIVSTGELAAQARALFAANLPVLDLNATPASPRPAVRAPPRPDDVAYIIYTSGSTGAPKGVFQNHRGVLHDVMQSVAVGPVTHEDRLSLFYSPAVIAGLRTLLSGILVGAAMEVLPPFELGREGLARAIKARGVTRMSLSPTLFRHIVGALAADERLDSVHTVVLGGERIDWGDFDVFERGCPRGAKLYVHLGATECWTVHTQWCVDPAVRASSRQLPSGRAIPDRTATIVREDGTPAAEGEAGEIVVLSRYIALGYWREPELTAKSFGVDPTDPLRRSYKTGDLARRRADGLIEFVGRTDQQIKLHGYRIEPNEVEAALKACVGVSDAAVLVRRSAAGLPIALVGYAQLQAGERGLLPRHLLAMLSQRIPPHMMPAEIVLVDELPWLPNFKIDRIRLAQLDAAQAAARSALADSPMVAELIEIFQRVTKISGATPSDNILTLGGDSLQTLELALEISRCFQVVVPESAHDANRTIAEWAHDIAVWRRTDLSGGAH